MVPFLAPTAFFVSTGDDRRRCRTSQYLYPAASPSEGRKLALAVTGEVDQEVSRQGSAAPESLFSGRGRDLPSIALVIPDDALDLEAVASALRRFSIHPIVLPRTEHLGDWLARWKPSVALVGGGTSELRILLTGLERQSVAVVLIGAPDQLREAASQSRIEAGVPIPATSEEIGQAVAIAAGLLDPEGKAIAEVGPVRIDLIQRAARIDGNPVPLPRREFCLLAELASHPNEPISAIDLARRAWPEQPNATQEDVRQCVYRLRRFIGDDRRESPLIQNRRGFGYFLQQV